MILKTAMLVIFSLAPAALATMQDPPPRPRPPEGHRPGGAERMRRGGPDRRPPRGPEWSELSDAERKDIESFTQEHFPRMAVELDRLKETAPQRYERRMGRVAMEMHRLMDTMAIDPRRATAMIRERQVGLQLQQLAKDYHAANDDEEKVKIRKRVREMASQEFDNRLERRNMEVRQLETKLAELKGRLSEMESVREDMLDRRTRELLERKPKREDRDSDDEPDDGPDDGPDDREPPGPGEPRGPRDRRPD